MRLLGLDVGDKRIGVALSEGGILARPLAVIHRRSRVEDFAAVAELVRAHGIERIVVGLPMSTEGEAGPQAHRVKRYVRDLAGTLPDAPVVFVDESYTTVDAVDIMTATGQSSKKRRERVDAVAAAVILQSYLDANERRDPGTNSWPE